MAYKTTENTLTTIIQPNFVITSSYPTTCDLPQTPMFEYMLKRTDNSPYRHLGVYNPHSDVPIRCPSNSNMFITRFSGPTKKLTVVLIGNNEIPNVKMHSSTVTIVEFVGHISFTSPIFEIISQLPLVTKVNIFVGKWQLPIFREFDFFDRADNVRFDTTSLCPQVQEFKVNMDLDSYFYPSENCTEGCKTYCWDMLKFTYDTLVDCILKRATHSFPNLKKLFTNLPETDLYFGSINNLIQSSPYLSISTSVKVVEGPYPDSKAIRKNSLPTGGCGDKEFHENSRKDTEVTLSDIILRTNQLQIKSEKDDSSASKRSSSSKDESSSDNYSNSDPYLENYPPPLLPLKHSYALSVEL